MARKKRRVTLQEDEAARRRFLNALEAQRSKSRNQEVEQAVEHQTDPVPLPGFYYDKIKRRYFRKSPTSERQKREALELRPQKLEAKPKSKVRRRRQTWVATLAQRQADFAWSAQCRDTRELLPKVMSQRLASQHAESQDFNSDGRLTALALHPRVSHVGAVASSSGRWQVLRQQQFESSLKRVLPIYDSYSSGLVTSLQWRSVQELDVLVCRIGAAQRCDSVMFIRLENDRPSGDSFVSTARMTRTNFYNPWVAKWNPVDTCKISVGHGDHDKPRRQSRAAYVDVAAESHWYQRAPSGLLSTDVHAQSFFLTGRVVVNGTKCGGLWGWDLRAPRRMFEMRQEETLTQRASIVDLHVLNDCCQAIVQRSNGELRLLDLRTLKPVVEYVPGTPKRYMPDLRCTIDAFESIVVAGGDGRRPLAINSFGLRQGQRVSSREVRPALGTEKPLTGVQQVQFKSSQCRDWNGNTRELWAISRNELYVCSGPSNAFNA